MDKQPKEITVCYLEVVLMPNGEIISLGKTVGWFRDYKDYLTPKEALRLRRARPVPKL